MHETGNRTLVIRPNRSLSLTGIAVLFLALSAMPLVIGVGFALRGAWPVLPFALLHVAVVGALCRWLYRHIDDCELVVIEPDRVGITQRQGTRVTRHDFSRHWVRVIRQGANGADAPKRLLVGSHGKFVSLAEGVNDADRAVVARELEALLRAPG